MLTQWGVDRLGAHAKALTDRVRAMADHLGLRTPSKFHHIIGVSKVGDPQWSERCSKFLLENGVVINSRFGRCLRMCACARVHAWTALCSRSWDSGSGWQS